MTEYIIFAKEVNEDLNNWQAMEKIDASDADKAIKIYHRKIQDRFTEGMTYMAIAKSNINIGGFKADIGQGDAGEYVGHPQGPTSDLVHWLRHR